MTSPYRKRRLGHRPVYAQRNNPVRTQGKSQGDSPQKKPRLPIP